MTRIFDKDNRCYPVTAIEIKSNTVSQVKDKEKDGYHSIQIAYGQKKAVKKPQIGHLKKAGLNQALRVKEFPLADPTEKFKLGDTLNIDNFKPGDRVSLSAVSKGKGFAGTVKRHGFKIGPISHGSNNQRRPGSIGSTTPAHVFKGQRMAGRLGGNKVTLKKVKIIDVIANDNLLLLKGSIPGPKGSIVAIWQK